MSIDSNTGFTPSFDPTTSDYTFTNGENPQDATFSTTPFESDTISTAGTQDPVGGPRRISLLEAQLTVGLSRILLDSVSDESETFNATVHQELYQALAIEAASYGSVFGSFIYLSERIESTTNTNWENVNNVQSSVNSYNNTVLPADNQAITELNTAIQAYNAGTISESEYNAAVQKYNDYVANRSTSSDYTAYAEAAGTFNAGVEETNQEIDGINADLEAAEITPPIEHQSTLSLNAMPTIDISGTPPNISTLSTLSQVTVDFNTDPPPNYEDRVDTYLENVLDLLQGSVGGYGLRHIENDMFGYGYFGTGMMFSDEARHSYVQSMLVAFYKFLPDLFFTPNPNVESDSDTTVEPGSGSAVSLASISEALTSDANQTILNNFRDMLDRNDSVLSLAFTATVLAIHQSNLYSMAQLSLAAGTLSIRYFKRLVTKFLDIPNPAVRAIVSLAILSEFKSAVAGGLFLGAAQNVLLNTLLNASPTLTNSIAVRLALVSQLSFLVLGLAQMVQGLGNLSLFGSVLALLEANTLLGITNPSMSFADVLNNAVLLGNLTSTLAASLVLTMAISNVAALEIIGSAIAATLLLGVDLTKDNFATLLSVELIAGGLTESDALAISALASSYIEAEIIGAAVLDNPLTAAFLAGGLLSNVLVASLVANNTFATVRDLRDALATELVNGGEITLAEAFLAATVLLAGALPLVTTMTKEEIRTALRTAVLEALGGLSTEDAENLANEIVDAILGSEDGAADQPSLIDLLNENLNALLGTNDPQTTQAIVDALKELLSDPAALWTVGSSLQSGALSFLEAYFNMDRTTLPPDSAQLQA